MPTDAFETFTPSAPHLTLLSPVGLLGRDGHQGEQGACW